jgi:hypothetical protein
LTRPFIVGKEGDVGVIKINDPGVWALTTKPHALRSHGQVGTLGKEFPSVPVIGEETPALNHKSCFEGQTTGETCGKIVDLNAAFEQEPGVITEGLIEVEGAEGAPGAAEAHFSPRNTLSFAWKTQMSVAPAAMFLSHLRLLQAIERQEGAKPRIAHDL